MNIALRRFLHNHGNIATEGSPKPGLCPTLISNDSMVLYSAQYHRQHCTLHAFKQFGALYMHNHDDNLVPPGYKPQSIRMSHRGRPGLVEQAVIILDFGGRQGSLSFSFNIKTSQNWSFCLRLKPRFVCFHTLAATLIYQNPYKYSWKCISTTTGFLYQNYRAYMCVTFLVKLFLL